MNPESLRYSDEHEWVGESNGVYVVGITDFAQEKLGDITYVELPAVGRKLARGEEAAIVESVKAASDVFAPVGGTVAEVNYTLENDPGLINRDPFGRGWIFKLTDINPAQYEELMAYIAYRAFCQGEA